MNKITCIAVDDEPLALGLMVSHIEKTPFLEFKAGFDNPIDASEFLMENSVDLIFLDIQMPDLTGTEFARTLKDDCKVIFTTAYDKYAVEGFQLHALDYLLKPISYEVFLKSVMHAKQYFDMVKGSDKNSSVDTQEDFLFIKADYQIHRIELANILYFEGLKDYIKLYLAGSDKPIVFHATMKSMEEKLPAGRFMRIHRSYIVSLNQVKTIEHDRIIFGDNRIPVSKAYKPAFDEFVRGRFL